MYRLEASEIFVFSLVSVSRWWHTQWKAANRRYSTDSKPMERPGRREDDSSAGLHYETLGTEMMWLKRYTKWGLRIKHWCLQSLKVGRNALACSLEKATKQKWEQMVTEPLESAKGFSGKMIGDKAKEWPRNGVQLVNLCIYQNGTRHLSRWLWISIGIMTCTTL